MVTSTRRTSVRIRRRPHRRCGASIPTRPGRRCPRVDLDAVQTSPPIPNERSFPRIALTRNLLAAIAAAAAVSAFAQSVSAVVATKPGAGMVAQTVDVTATITAIDPSSRLVTMKGPQGREVAVVAGPEVKNFANMKVGD